MVNDPGEPTAKVAWSLLTMAGAWGASATVRVNVWVTSPPTPLWAVIVSGYTPPLPAAGVPARVADPPPPWNVTPSGNVPDAERVGAGKPVAVTVTVPATPTTKVAAFPLATAAGS